MATLLQLGKRSPESSPTGVTQELIEFFASFLFVCLFHFFDSQVLLRPRDVYLFMLVCSSQVNQRLFSTLQQSFKRLVLRVERKPRSPA